MIARKWQNWDSNAGSLVLEPDTQAHSLSSQDLLSYHQVPAGRDSYDQDGVGLTGCEGTRKAGVESIALLGSGQTNFIILTSFWFLNVLFAHLPLEVVSGLQQNTSYYLFV